jgi:NAD-dependent oxidoreductase involved in siderophore biosynthesis
MGRFLGWKFQKSCPSGYCSRGILLLCLSAPHSLQRWPQLGLQQTKKSVIPSSPLAVACRTKITQSHGEVSLVRSFGHGLWKKTASPWPQTAQRTSLVRGSVGSPATSWSTWVNSPALWCTTFRYTQLLSAISYGGFSRAFQIAST